MFDFVGIELNFDWSWVYNLGEQPLYAIAWHFVVNGGWVLFLAAFIWGGWRNFVYIKNVQFSNKQTYIMLAVDVPKNNIQTPRAVENFFVALAGAHMPLEWVEKNIKGEFQLGFACEIVSIDGYIQFLIRTPSQWRTLVEAALYSQYPEADITEVEDYTESFDVKFPSDEYNLWGADLVMVKPDYYPIKTYMEFQEELDNEFKSPMASLLEIMGKIGPGEQIWFQILVYPADIGWEKKGIKAANKLLGIPEETKYTTLDKIAEAPLKAMSKVGDELMRGFGWAEGAADEKKKEDFNMMRLAPKEKREVDAILRKADKISFDCKARFLYIGKREVFKKGLGVSGMMGAIKQFTSTGLNALKPGKNKTQARFVLTDMRLARRQNKILANYKGRNASTCSGPYLMNAEELATMFHFPPIEVKTPLVRKVQARKSSAPIGLPISEDEPVTTKVNMEPPEEEKAEYAPVIDYDNDYFEQRFAKDKTGLKDKKRKEMILNKIEKERNKENEEDNNGEDTQGFESQKHGEKAPLLDLEPEESDVDFDEEKFKQKEEDTPGNLPFV